MFSRSHVSLGFLRPAQVLSRGQLRSYAGKRRPARSTPLPQSETPAGGAEKVDVRSFVRRYWPGLLISFVLGTSSFAFFAVGTAKSEKHRTLLVPEDFKPFVLISKETVSPTSSIFTLVPQQVREGQKTGWEEFWRKGVWSVEAKQPQLQIARSYTPLPPSEVYDGFEKYQDGALRFLIRQEVNGEVSGYLHKLPLGATIDLRGPHLEYSIDEDVEEIVFIAGGTGIAPALQALNSFLSTADRGERKLRILWANKRREDCQDGVNTAPQSLMDWLRILVGLGKQTQINPSTIDRVNTQEQSAIMKELLAWKQRDNVDFGIDFFVDEEGSHIDQAALRRYLSQHRPSAERAGNEDSKQPSRKVVLLSGPDGFIEAMAGRKMPKNARGTQGRVGGLLGSVEHQDWTVWKL